MKIVEPSFKILDELNREQILKKLEYCGRVCYKSEDKITCESASNFVSMLIRNEHESVLEHVSFSVKFIVDRGISHEIVRHRIASYSQESTRYCNYSKDKFENQISVIEPVSIVYESKEYEIWKKSCEESEKRYFELLEKGAFPETARSVLPTSLKTEIIKTANLRQWRHFIKLRKQKVSHPQIRFVTFYLLLELKKLLPEIFGDIK